MCIFSVGIAQVRVTPIRTEIIIRATRPLVMMAEDQGFMMAESSLFAEG